MGLFSLIGALIIPLALLLGGLLMIKSPSGDTSSMFYGYGYRSRRSMASTAAKEFADRYAGRLWLIAGSIMLPVSLIAVVLLMRKGVGESASLIILIIQVVTMSCLSIPVELALKRNFDENGQIIV